MRFKVVRHCNSEVNTCIPLDDVTFDLDATGQHLHQLGYEVESKDIFIIARKDGVAYTIYRTGKLLIDPMAKDRAKEEAARFYPLCIVREG